MTTENRDTGERRPLPRRLQAVSPNPEELPVQTIRVRDREGNAMRLTPSIFGKLRNATGVVAIILDFIDQKQLYKAEGVHSIREYVVDRHGLAPSQFTLYRQAGKIARAYYSNLHEEVLRAVDTAGGDEEYPFVPSARSLVLLLKVMRRLPRDEALRWHSDVEAGTVGERQLEEKLKQLRPPPPPLPLEKLRTRLMDLAMRCRGDAGHEHVSAAVDAFISQLGGLPTVTGPQPTT